MPRRHDALKSRVAWADHTLTAPPKRVKPVLSTAAAQKPKAQKSMRFPTALPLGRRYIPSKLTTTASQKRIV